MKFEHSSESTENTYQGTMDSEKTYEITFRENRSFELHIRKTIYSFNAYGSQIVPRSVIDHPDFKQQEKYFTVKEVS